MLEVMRVNASLVSAVEMARVFGLNFQEVFMGQMRRMWGYCLRKGKADLGCCFGIVMRVGLLFRGTRIHRRVK